MSRLHFLLLFLCSALGAVPNRIVHKGQEIFLNGMNVAWGKGPFFCSDINVLYPNCTTDACKTDVEYFEGMVSDLANNGGNSMRLWFHGDGGNVPVVDNDYNNRMVDHITANQVNSIQWILDLGKRYNVLFNFCLWSFDMVNDNGYSPANGLWNKIVTDDQHLSSYIDNWLVPLVEAVKDHPNLLSFEVFNEPEGMTNLWGWTNCTSETPDCARVEIVDIQRFANRITSAIHNVSAEVKVTVGSWSYMASGQSSAHNNIWSDAALVAAGGCSNGVLDYYQIHYYNWAFPEYSPFLFDVSHWNALDKPHVIGEFPNDPMGVNPDQMIYERLYDNNYAGAWGWCYNSAGNDSFDKGKFLMNTKYMQDTYGAKNWPQV